MKKSLRKISHKSTKNKRNKNPKSFKNKLRRKIKKSLKKSLGWEDGTANSVAGFICSLLSYGRVWQKELARESKSGNKRESDVRSLQRFFKNHYLNYTLFSMMIFKMIDRKNKVTILIDRTNWDYGKKHINILVAAALWAHPQLNQRFAVPLIWEVFDKNGNSNTQERKHLMQQLIDVVGKGNIEEVLGDREFIGDEWIAFLHENLIPYVLRIKKNMHVEIDGKRVKAEALVASVQQKERKTFNVKLNGIPVQLVATLSVENELVIVVASMGITDPLSEYRLRWLIELFFKSIKSKGFHVEETHMTDPERIKKLFAFIALATAYTVLAGVLKHCYVKKISIKNHGRSTYSFFSYGLDFIRDLFEGKIIEINCSFFDFNFSAPKQKSSDFALGVG